MSSYGGGLNGSTQHSNLFGKDGVPATKQRRRSEKDRLYSKVKCPKVEQKSEVFGNNSFNLKWLYFKMIGNLKILTQLCFKL